MTVTPDPAAPPGDALEPAALAPTRAAAIVSVDRLGRHSRCPLVLQRCSAFSNYNGRIDFIDVNAPKVTHAPKATYAPKATQAQSVPLAAPPPPRRAVFAASVVVPLTTQQGTVPDVA